MLFGGIFGILQLILFGILFVLVCRLLISITRYFNRKWNLSHFPERRPINDFRPSSFLSYYTKNDRPMNYSIKWCPIPFHDLMEIFDFLQHLSVVRLYQFDGADILLNGRPILHLQVYFLDGFYRITYRICRF